MQLQKTITNNLIKQIMVQLAAIILLLLLSYELGSSTSNKQQIKALKRLIKAQNRLIDALDNQKITYRYYSRLSDLNNFN